MKNNKEYGRIETFGKLSIWKNKSKDGKHTYYTISKWSDRIDNWIKLMLTEEEYKKLRGK